jgi:zinc transport system ATP-binding protein
MEANELIVCSKISLGYEGQSVLTDLNLTIRAGDYLCIVGDNGSGKSTLLRGILGLLTPQSGEILRASELKRGSIGYLPQQTKAQRDFPATVFEVVLSGCLNRKGARFFYTAAQKSEALMNMGKLGILELKGESYRNLSGGQQQRVLLARALCATRRLLLMDEPVSGLDPRVTAEMYALIERLNRDGVTIIMISHNIGAATRYATHILHLGGAEVFFGTRSQYTSSALGRRFDVAEGGAGA